MSLFPFSGAVPAANTTESARTKLNKHIKEIAAFLFYDSFHFKVKCKIRKNGGDILVLRTMCSGAGVMT